VSSELLFLELLRERFAQEVLDSPDQKKADIWLLLFNDVDADIAYLQSSEDSQEEDFQTASWEERVVTIESLCRPLDADDTVPTKDLAIPARLLAAFSQDQDQHNE